MTLEGDQCGVSLTASSLCIGHLLGDDSSLDSKSSCERIVAQRSRKVLIGLSVPPLLLRERREWGEENRDGDGD